jgi:hypothetical protein
LKAPEDEKICLAAPGRETRTVRVQPFTERILTKDTPGCFRKRRSVRSPSRKIRRGVSLEGGAQKNL